MQGAEWNLGDFSNASSAFVSEELKPSMEAIELVPRHVAYAARLVPLRVEGRKLVCAGVLPFEWSQLRMFEAKVSREVDVVGASAEAVEQGLRQIYGVSHYEEADTLIDQIASPHRMPKPSSELAHSERATTGPMKVVAVTSGKGGVGKSSTTANLAISLSLRGYKVGVVDCDFGLSNMHVMLGSKPEWNLSDVIAKKVSMRGAFELTTGGIYLLAGPTGAAEMADLNYSTLQNAGAGLSEIDSAFDFLFLDTAAGIHDGVMSLLLAADEVLLVLTPDPASIMDAYVTTRALLERRPQAVIKCLVNQVANESEAKLIFAKFMTFVSLNTSGRAKFVGKVVTDRAVAEGARTKSPVCVAQPRSQAARDFDAAAATLAGLSVESSDSPSWMGKLFSFRKAA